MKNILTFLLLLVAGLSYGHADTTKFNMQGTPASKVGIRGYYASDSGFVSKPTDTLNPHAPLGTVRFDNQFRQYIFTGTRWLPVGGDGGLDTAVALSLITWSNLQSKPATFPPATHSHSTGDITGLQASLDNKASLSVLADTAASIRSAIVPGTGIDTSSLSTRINQRLKYSDTAAMLDSYARKASLKDTATILRTLISSTAVDTGSLSTRINQRVKYTDTAAMLALYATKGALNDTATVLRSLIGSSAIDTGSLSTRINQRVKYTDTAAMLAPYLRSATAGATYAPINTTVTLNGIQTLTNKTITGPSITAPILTGISSGGLTDSLLVADPSSGSVKRISGSRLSGVKYVANVKDYGAVGNGLTNDRAAFAAAVATGLDVYVPASADGYAIDSTITLKPGQSIFGDGSNSKIIFQNPYATGFYMIRTVGFNSVKNLQFFVGLKPTWISDNPVLWVTGAVYVAGFANIIRNCWFKTISGAAIHITGQNTNVSSCYVDDNVCGVLVSSEYNHVSNINGSNNRRAVYITTGNNTLSGCNFLGGGGLFYNNISNGDHSSVIGCTFNHCSDPNLESKNTGSGLNVIGCNFWDGQIKITESNGLNLTNCTIGTSISFSVSGTNTNCVLQNNFIVNTVSLPSDPGIRLLNNFGGASNKYPRSLDQSASIASGTGGVKYAPLELDGTTYYIKLETSVP